MGEIYPQHVSILKILIILSLIGADEVNKTQEAELGQAVADLTTIADQNKAVGDDSTEHRKVRENFFPCYTIILECPPKYT